MAAHTPGLWTLGASVVDTVTITGDAVGFRITNHDASTRLTYTYDGSTPTVDGAGARYLPPGAADEITLPGQEAQTLVKVISSGAVTYSVEALS